MLLEAGRRAQHLRQGEPRAEQEQQEAQRPARRGRRLGAELQLDVLERRAAVVRGSRRGGWGCVAAAWRRAVRLTGRVAQDAHVARCTFVRVLCAPAPYMYTAPGWSDAHSGAVRCGVRVVVVWGAVWLRAVALRPFEVRLTSIHDHVHVSRLWILTFETDSPPRKQVRNYARTRSGRRGGACYRTQV